MQFENMREFLTLAETQNYLAAADKLYMAQSTLSRHIKGMEESIGAPLFNRNSKKVRLTQLGVKLLPYAKQAVELQDAYMDVVSDYLSNLQTPLYIGLPSSWNSWGVSELLSEFQIAYNNVQVNIVLSQNSDLPTMVQNNELSLALAIETETDHYDGLDRILFDYEPPLVALVPLKHALAQQATIRIEELQTENLLLMAEGSFPYMLSMQLCHEAGFEPKYSFKGITGKVMHTFVEKGLGIALVPDTPDLLEHTERTKRVELQPTMQGNINLIFKESKLSEAGKCFLDFFRDF